MLGVFNDCDDGMLVSNVYSLRRVAKHKHIFILLYVQLYTRGYEVRQHIFSIDSTPLLRKIIFLEDEPTRNFPFTRSPA